MTPSQFLPADLRANGELAQEWHEDCMRHFWWGVVAGTVLAALVCGIFVLS